MKKDSVLRIVEACVILVLGVLFCVSKSVAINFLSITIGIGLIAGGVALIVISLVKDKSLFNPYGLGGAFALTVGIFFIARDALQFLFQITPFLLIVFGAAFLAEAFIAYFGTRKSSSTMFAIRLIIAVVFITVGILLLTVEAFSDWVALIIGIAFILIAIAAMITEFTRSQE